MTTAPIVLFVYNRLAHTQRTVEALQQNVLSNDSDLIIYSDAPKTPEATEAVREVREYVRTISGFRSINIIERDSNWGLARSIIEGVTAVVNQYGRIIVLEDDIVTSQYFLDFMNRALDYYVSEPRVWHISGWTPPIDHAGLPEAFFSRAMYCWGWATWADRWEHFQKAPDRLLAEWSVEEIDQFNLDGKSDFWEQVKQNVSGSLNTWAVFWYATIFEHNALCLNPSVTYVENIGHDKSGENCGDTTRYSAVINPGRIERFPDEIIESSIALTRIQQFYTGVVVDQTTLLSGMVMRIRKLFQKKQRTRNA